MVIAVSRSAYDKLHGTLQALHHPFTAPNPEDMEDLASARALAYDMVYNGVEVYGLWKPIGSRIFFS